MKEIEINITHHSKAAGKWEFDYYGNRSIRDDYGTIYYYQHAKFRLPPSIKYPKGKPKCERLSDDLTPEQVLKFIQKKYNNFKFRLNNDQNVQVSDTTDSSNEDGKHKK